MAYKDLIEVNKHGAEAFDFNQTIQTDAYISSSKDEKVAINLENIYFDNNIGFVWDGKFDINFFNGKKTQVLGNGITRDASFILGIDKDGNNSFSYNPMGNPASTVSNSLYIKSELANRDNSIEKEYFLDLQKLLDEYFWDILEKEFCVEEKSKKELFQYIEENNLVDEVSLYLSGIIDAYNNSYQNNKEDLRELYDANTHDFSSRRYLACINDESFKNLSETDLMLLKMRTDANDLLGKNIRGDKEKSFLSRVDSFQELFPDVLREFGWRISDEKYSGMGTKAKVNITLSDARYLKKSFKELYTDLNKGLISEDEKKAILEYERDIFKGSISEEDRANYNNLVKTIENRYTSYLDRIDSLYSSFSRRYLDDDTMRKFDKDRADGNPFRIGTYLNYAKSNFKHFEFERENNISPEIIANQNRNLDEKINHFLEKTTYTSTKEVDGKVVTEEKEMILLDRYKQALIDKIDAVKQISNPELRDKEMQLVLEDVKALNDIQYTIEVTCGIKNTYLNEMQESQKRALLGENYQYLSFNAFLDKIEEISNQNKEDFLIDAKVTTFEKALEQSFSNVFLTEKYSEEDKIFFAEVKKYILGENDTLGIKVEEEIKKVLDVNNQYSIDSLEKFLLESNNDKILKVLNANNPIKDEYLKEVMKFFTEAEETVTRNAEIISSNERVIAAEKILESINSDINHRIRNENSKKQLENQMNQIIQGVSPSGTVIDGGIGKELFGDADLKKIFFKSDGNHIDVKKILEVRKSIIRILDEVNEQAPSVNNNVKYTLDSSTIQKIKDNPVLKEALYDKLVIIEEQFLDYKVARKEGEKAIYVKPEIAGDALVRAIDEMENLKGTDLSSIYNDKNKEIEDRINKIDRGIRKLEKELKEKQSDLEDIEYELEETKSKKALKALEEEKADLEEDIRLLKEDLDLLHEQGSYLEKEKSNYDVDIQSDISIKDERDKTETEITSNDKEYLSLLMKKRDLLEREGLNSNDNEQEIKELDELIEGLQLELKEKGVDVENIEAAELEQTDSKFNTFFESKIGSLFKSLKKDSEDEMSDLEKVESDLDKVEEKINNLIEDRGLLVEKLELINKVENQFFDSSKDIYDRLQKDLIRSMEKDNFTEANKENVQILYSSLSSELSNIRIVIDKIYTDKENKDIDKDSSNRAFDVMASSLKDISKEDFMDFINKNHSERASFIKDSVPKDSKGIYIALHNILKDVDYKDLEITRDNEENKTNKPLLKPELIDKFEQFFETQKDVYQENQDKIFNISEYKESINEYLRNCSLIPLNINATNKLFEKLNSNEDILTLSVGEETFNISSNTLNELKTYLQDFDESKLTPEKVQTFNSIIKELEAEGVDSLKISLKDSAKENLKVTLKAYGDENSVLILTGFNDFETEGVQNISINAERLYSVDSIVDNLGQFISEDGLKIDFEEFEKKHPNQFIQAEKPLTIDSSIGEINDVFVLNEALNNQDTLNIDDVNAFLKSIKEEGTTIQEFIRDSYEDDDYNKSLLERLSQLKGLDTEYKKAIEEVLIDDYGADIDNIRSQELLRQVEELDKSPKEIQKESEEVKKENEELKKTNEEVKKENKELKAVNEQQQKEIEDLKRQLEEANKSKEKNTSKDNDSDLSFEQY